MFSPPPAIELGELTIGNEVEIGWVEHADVLACLNGSLDPVRWTTLNINLVDTGAVIGVESADFT